MKHHLQTVTHSTQSLSGISIEQLPDAAIICSPDGRIIDVNSKLLDIFKYKRDELVGKVIEVLIPPECRKGHKVKRETMVSEKQSRPFMSGLTLKGYTKDNKIVPIDISIKQTIVDDQEFILAIIRDNSVWEEENNQLRSFYQAIKDSHDAMVILDTRMKITFSNTSFTRQTGFDSNYLLGNEYPILSEPDEQIEIFEEMKYQLETGGNWKGKVRTLVNSDDDIYAEISLTVINNEDDEPCGYIGIQRDVTTKVMMDEANYFWANSLEKKIDLQDEELEEQSKLIEKSEERFKLILQGTNDGIWDWNVKEGHFFFSKQWKRMLGYNEDEVENTFNTWVKLIHPDDRGIMLDVWTDYMLSNERLFRTEYRIRKKNGSYIHVECKGIAIRDKEGLPCMMAGCNTDITKRKEAEMVARAYKDNLENIIQERTRELDEANKRLEKLASEDELTGLANRRAFIQRFRHEWARAARYKNPVSIIMIDIDFFKKFNDTFGHVAGDKCLKQIASEIKSSANRSSDLAARYGGEEFIVLLDNAEIKGAQEIAELIRENIEKLAIAGPDNKPVTISVGVASMIPLQHHNEDSLILAADNALYKAKETGRNRVCSAE